MNRRTRIGVLALAGIAALVAAAAASAHAIVSPPVALDKKLQVFTLSVPTEEEGATTTTIQLTVPSGFAIDSFEPTPGWTRVVAHGGTVVTWSGGRTPTEEDSMFRFNANTSGARTYVFDVKQTYSNGKVVDWTGPESSDTPAPTVDAVSSFASGGTPLLSIVGVVLGALALLVALAGLLRGGRTLA
ncbi:MAG: DUF1775 domain-containing protein [Actinobacteria bacterium]|nr:DUF1775 domain-containing protein [Actinomycetota bacterium]